MAEQFDTAQYNKEIRDWGKSVQNTLKTKVSALGIKGKTELLKKLRSPEALMALQKRVEKEGYLQKSLYMNYRSQYGEIFRIGIRFSRQGIWVQKGVSRMHPVASPRTARDWFNAPIDAKLPELADLVVKHKADQVLNASLAGWMKVK